MTFFSVLYKCSYLILNCQAPLPQRASQQQQQQPQAPGRGGWVNRGGMRRGRGRSGTSGSGFSRTPGSGQQTGTSGKPKNIIKFENDFDFEQANKEFDTLRSQLAKTKIGKALLYI